MASIVLGVGASHGPTVQTPPDRWLLLGEKDREDPRYDFGAVLDMAPPDIEDQITPERMLQRHEANQRGMQRVREVMADAAADAYVVISNPHGVAPANRMEPVIGIYMSGTEAKIGRSGHQTGGHRGRAPEIKPTISGRPVDPYATMPPLADHLMERLIQDGFDVASCFQTDPTAGIEGPFTFPADMFMLDRTTPLVPFLLSRYLPHQATPARCYALGQAIRRAIDAWDSDKRVALFASGGLSHQIIDEEHDRMVIRALEERDVETLCTLDRERLNRAPGTPETLNWLVVAGAMEETSMTLIDYVPCYRSLAGTGHGVTFGYWQ